MPSTNHAKNFEFDTSSFHILRAHRKTIYGGVVKRRNELSGDDILCHNATRHLLTINNYGRDWLASTNDDFLRFN